MKHFRQVCLLWLSARISPEESGNMKQKLILSADRSQGSFCLKEEAYRRTLLRALEKGALFDARCFNIPKEEEAQPAVLAAAGRPQKFHPDGRAGAFFGQTAS